MYVITAKEFRHTVPLNFAKDRWPPSEHEVAGNIMFRIKGELQLQFNSRKAQHILLTGGFKIYGKS